MSRSFTRAGALCACPLCRAFLLLAGVSLLPIEQAIAADANSLRPGPILAQAAPPPAPPASDGSLSLDLDVVAKQLDVARGQIQPSLGASVYEFRRDTIEMQPQGDNQSFNQLLLQAPGVTQDSFGQLHVRGDHANLQFRINGVQLPEGINVFGQALQTRLANSVSLITGALPAQYGFRTAGIIDIETKTGTLNPDGSITFYGGMRDWFQPSVEYGGRVGSIDYYVTSEYLQNAIGIENPAGTFNALHDNIEQGRGFAYLSGILDPTTRLTAIIGTARSQYQIPNVAGMSPGLGLNVNGTTDFNSAQLNQNQRQITHYAIGTLQKNAGPLDFQVSLFNRYSSVYFNPDPLGDLLFNGIGQTAYRRSIATGTQGDASYRLTPDHTLRGGFFVQGERSTFNTNSQVLPVDATGAQTSDQPFGILDSGGKTGWLYGIYLQDEWKVLPNLTVNFGGRFDLVDAFTHENQISPRVNVVWQPFETTTLKAGYSRYFTPPPFELVGNTTIGLFANTTAAPPNTNNNVVKAERADYFDIGGTQILLPGLKAGVDLYYKFSTNLLDEGQFGAPIILTPFNYSHGINRGVELSLTYDMDNWHFYANLAITKALGKNIVSSQFNFSPDDLAYIASHYIHTDHDQTYTASGGISYTLPTTNTRFSVDMLAGSGLRADGDHPNGRSLPSYEQVNLSIVQKIDTGFWRGLEARLDVINLFDQVYQIRNGTGVGVGAPQFGPRRTVLAGLTQHF
jgi:outer membrane receptor protein involved in Fe transport